MLAAAYAGGMKARRLVIFHGVCTVIWVVLLVPTVVAWRNSILWLAVMSVWANVISHATAWQAARAERAASKEKGPTPR